MSFEILKKMVFYESILNFPVISENFKNVHLILRGAL